MQFYSDNQSIGDGTPCKYKKKLYEFLLKVSLEQQSKRLVCFSIMIFNLDFINHIFIIKPFEKEEIEGLFKWGQELMSRVVFIPN